MKKTLFFLVLLPVFAIQSYAQSNILDRSFATGGTLTVRNDNVAHARSVAVQSDGKILTAGEGVECNSSACNPKFTLTRHNADGSLDVSFGQGGIAFINPSENGSIDYVANASNLVIGSDGKLLVTGEYSEYDYTLNQYSNFYTTVIRLNTDGSLDNSFGGNGIVNIKLSSNHEKSQGIAVQADLKVILVGMAFNASLGSSSMTVCRLNTDGSLDNSFNNNGKLFVNFPDYSEGLNAKVQSDGKIVACGIAYSNKGQYDFAVVRLNPDGSYDNQFDLDGKALIDLGGRNHYASDLDLQADGKIVIGGYVEAQNNFDFGIARLNMDGSLDKSFDKDGKKMIDFNSSDDVCFAISVDEDGKIFLGGYSNRVKGNLAYNFNITKLNADGSLDKNFSDGGTKFIDFGSAASSYDFALQTNGKIVAAGYAANGSKYERALASFGTGSTSKTKSALDIALMKEGELSPGLELKSAPNPSFNSFTVRVNSTSVNEKITLRVTDFKGRVVDVKNMYSGETFTMGSKLTPGIYYLEATQGQQKKVLKVIKSAE